MLEVAAIVDAHSITAIPADINEPQPMSPAMLLTQMTCQLGTFLGSFSSQDLCDQSGWRRVEFLAEQLSTRWRLDHIINLQARKKWTQEWWNLIIRDFLRKEEQDHSNYWPLAIVVDAAKGKDGGVRKTTVMVYKDKKMKIFVPLYYLFPLNTLQIHRKKSVESRIHE